MRQSLYEARRNLEQMDHGRSLKCEAVTRVLSDADRRITRRRDIRAHLRDCPDCRHFQEAIGKRKDVLGGIPALPTAAAAGIAQALLGGSGGGGTVAALTGSVAKSAGVYGALKAAGTVVVVAVVGTAAMQGEMKSAPLTPRPSRRSGAALRSSSPQRVVAVPTAHPGNPSHAVTPLADDLPSADPSMDVSDGQARPSPARRGFAAENIPVPSIPRARCRSRLARQRRTPRRRPIKGERAAARLRQKRIPPRPGRSRAKPKSTKSNRGHCQSRRRRTRQNIPSIRRRLRDKPRRKLKPKRSLPDRLRSRRRPKSRRLRRHCHHR